MKLRKLRSTSFGRTNNDFRFPLFNSSLTSHYRSIRKSMRFNKNLGMTRINYLSMPRKTETYDKMFETRKRFRGTAPEPFRQTQQFYTKNKKLQKTRVSIDQPRPYLNDEHLMRRRTVFQGDSHVLYEKNPMYKSKMAKSVMLNKYREGKSSQTKWPLPGTKPFNLKGTVNAKAAIETQLVPQTHLHETLKGKVNLEKVRDIRRALRRRYATRRKIQKIFRSWDRGSKGHVSIDDVLQMVNNLGHKINFDEARVLVASADRDADNRLKLDEFLDMIYSDQDTLNVDLQKITKLYPGQNTADLDVIDIAQLQKDAKQGRLNRHNNQVSYILKQRMKEMNKSFVNNDFSGKGFVNFQQFENAIKKLQISEKIISENDIQGLFDKHRIDSHKVNYRNFLKDLQSFEFKRQDQYKKETEEEYNNRMQEATDNQNYKEKRKNKFAKNSMDILDPQLQPINQLEGIFKRGQKISRALQRYFPKQEDFESYIKESMQKEGYKDQDMKQLHSKTFQKVLQNVFKQFADDIDKRDVEGFLSKFKYNKHGYTNVENVGKILYEEDVDDFIKRVSNKTHGPPPNEKIIKGERSQLNDSYDVDQLLTINRPMRYDHDEDQKVLKQAIQKFDNVIFNGTGALKVYRSFDKDNDGYVSHNDLREKIQNRNILSKRETELLIKYADTNNKGYLDFKDFVKILRPNMSNLNKIGNKPYVTNSFSINKRLKKQNAGILSRIDEIKTPFIPDNYTKLKGCTRFGANPAWRNTFQLVQPPMRSSMYMSEKDRFKLGRLRKTQFQIDSKAKKQAIESARQTAYFNQKQKRYQIVNSRQGLLDLKQINKLKAKTQRQWEYEHNCRLQNNYE